MPTVIAVVVALAALWSGQATPSFAGVWVAEHSGQTFVRLELEQKGSSLTGRISLGDMELDKGGNIRKVSAAPATTKPLGDVALKERVLTFSSRDVSDVDQWEMKLVDATTAALLLKLSDDDLEELKSEGIPAPLPIRLKKQR